MKTAVALLLLGFVAQAAAQDFVAANFSANTTIDADAKGNCTLSIDAAASTGKFTYR